MKYTSWVDAPELGHRLDPYRYDPVFIGAHRRLTTQVATASLESLTTAPINYGILQPREFRDIGIPMVRAVDLGNPTVDWAEVRKVPPEVETPYRRSRLATGDVLLSIAGTLGAVGIVPPGPSVANVNQSVARIRPSPALDGGFIAAFLMTRLGQTILEREAVGSVQRHLNIEDVRTLRIPTPRSGIDRAIGNKLRKAERLREIGGRALSRAESRLQELTGGFEQSAQRTSWVGANTFEFARLDAEFYQPHYLVAARWFDENRTDRLEDLMISGSYGVLPESEDYGRGDMQFLRATDIGHLFVNHEDALTVPREYAHPKGTAHEGDVLLEVKGMISGGAVCPKEAEGYLVNGSIFLIRPKETVDPHYLAAVLVGPAGIVQKQRASSNSVISYVSLEFLRALRIPRFGSDVETAIGKDVRLFEKSRREAILLTKSATTAVEALIAGLLDEAALLAESDAIEAWLVANPSPDAKA